MKEPTLPTAKETLKEHGIWLSDFISSSIYSASIAAIESHTQAHTKELREEISDIKYRLRIATKGLRHVTKFDEQDEEEFEDPGYLAQYYLDKILK